MNRECWYPDKCVRLCIINPSLCTGSKHFSSPFDDDHFHFHWLPPSYFHHSISTMLFQNSLRLRKDKRSMKKSIFSRQNIFIVTFWKCFEWVQPGNHFKGILFLLQNSFRMNWFLLRLAVSVLGCCNWYGTLCMAALLDFFLQFVQLQLPYIGNRDVLYRLESFDILLFHVFTRVHQKLLNLQKN